MPDQKEVWTVIKLIEWSSDYLHGKGVENARLTVELLICSVLQCDRVALYLDFDRPLAEEELSRFKKLLLRRASREPLQYILGETEFFSLAFKIKPGVLIPRPETEILVEHAISFLSQREQKPRILDVGTGSGIIAITIAKHCPAAKVLAIDVSETALQLAAENASLHNASNRVDFIQCNLFDEHDWHVLGDTKFDLIVSNPPYIATSEKGDLAPEVRQFEPHEALFVEDAMRFYKALLQLARKKLAAHGQLVCEIAANRHAAVKNLFAGARMKAIELLPDLTGNMRVITAKIAL